MADSVRGRFSVASLEVPRYNGSSHEALCDMARILIIEDDEHVALVLKLGLASVPHEVITAGNGREGLAALQDKAFDLVITDIIMPEMEGLEMITKLRKSYPEISVIAISGGGRVDSQDYLKMAKALGASRVFAKPVEIEALREAVHELVAGD